MNNLPNEIVNNVFPEEKNRILAWIKLQKRNSRFWLLLFILLGFSCIMRNYQQVYWFYQDHPQLLINWILFSWIITLVLIPFIWPIKPGDVFLEKFKGGLDPRVWDWEGNWRVEIDENGKSVLTVTQSNMGGIVAPCLTWTNYEFIFETRIINQCTGWIVRSSDLNNYVMFQLNFDAFRPHIRSKGIWMLLDEFKYDFALKNNVWYTIRTIVRGSWASVSIFIDGKEHVLYQQRIFMTRPPIPIEIRTPQANKSESAQTIEGTKEVEPPRIDRFQLLESSLKSGSFGFRLDGNETAQFRNIQAYKLR